MSVSELKTLLLRPPSLTLAVAESLTCGQVQAAIGVISGASHFFLGGLTAYTGEQKIAHLGVSRAEGEAVNYVSAAVAEQMARGTLSVFGSALALATTGYAEPSPEHGVVEPFAWWALAYKPQNTATDFVHSERVDCEGCSRVETQKKVTAAALAGIVTFLKHSRNVRP